MNKLPTKQSAWQIQDMLRASSILLLLLDCYYYFHDSFVHLGWFTPFTERLMWNFYKTGLFKHHAALKALALLLAGLSLLGRKGKKSIKISYTSCFLSIGAGLMCYMGADRLSSVIGYAMITMGGYILVLSGGSRLGRILPSSFRHSDPFGEDQAGFPQEERSIKSSFGITIPASYTYKKRTIDSFVNVVNGRRGVLILGSPGSGKSWFIIEPIILQLMAKGIVLFIYDLKYDALTRLAFNLFQRYKSLFPPATRFYSINFKDLSHSHRCNLIEPGTMEWISDAIGASRTILLSMNRIWTRQQGEFFVESAVNFLAAVIWWLRKYQDGRFCTLPHVIELAQVSYDKLFSLLSLEPEVQVLISPFIETYRHGTMKMLDGQIAGARIPLGRLSSPDVYYILTGNDFTLDINDPAAPKIFCLGGDISRQEALAPVISLYIDRLNRRVNRPGKYPCGLICDEFATLRAYSMAETIATARSNQIIPVLAIQDLHQLYTQYSKDEADTILNIAGNVFCGQVGGETARWVSERFPKVQREKTGISTNSTDTSISHSLQWEPMVTPATIANLSSGEFVGVIADDPDLPMELKAFHAKLSRERIKATANDPIPPVTVLEDAGGFPAIILQAFEQVKWDINSLVNNELGRMATDDDLKGLLLTSKIHDL